MNNRQCLNDNIDVADHPTGNRHTKTKRIRMICRIIEGIGYRRDAFFIANLLERWLDLLVRHIDHLRKVVRATKRDRPFHIVACAVLPDHKHTIWTLQPSDGDFSIRRKSIKTRFLQNFYAPNCVQKLGL